MSAMEDDLKLRVDGLIRRIQEVDKDIDSIWDLVGSLGKNRLGNACGYLLKATHKLNLAAGRVGIPKQK